MWPHGADTTTRFDFRYEGGGIYRPVHLIAAPWLHIEPDGLFAAARVSGAVSGSGLNAPAVVEASVSVRSFATSSELLPLEKRSGLDERTSQVRFEVLNADGRLVANGSAALSDDTGSSSANATLSFRSAELWSITRPYLYTIIATIVQDGVDGDSANATFGIRSLKWTTDTGFYLNGQHTKIRGFCDRALRCVEIMYRRNCLDST